MNRKTIEFSLLAGTLFLTLIVVISIVIVWRNSRLRREADSRVIYTMNVLNELEESLSLIKDTQSGIRGYLITGNDVFLDPYRTANAEIGVKLRNFRELVRDHPDQIQRFSALQQDITEKLEYYKNVLQLVEDKGLEAGRQLISTGVGEQQMNLIRKLTREIREEEERLLQSRRDLAASTGQSMDVALFILTGLILCIVVTGYFIIQHYLTDRHRAEEALLKSEQNLSVTLYSIGDAVLATDAEGRVTRLNQVAEKLTGWLESEASGRSVNEVFNIINEQTRQPAVVPVSSVLETGEIHGLANHTVLVSRDGSEYLITDSAAPIRDSKGNVSGVVLVFRDMTAQQLAEAERIQFFTLATDMFCIAGTDGYFKRVNPAFSKTLGWTEEELLASSFLDFVHPDDVAATLEQVEKQIKGEPILQFSNRYRCKDGSFRWLAWKSIPLPGGILYATARDVTDQITAEEDMRLLNQNLQHEITLREAANKEIESFAHSVSHDLRAPLRHIHGYANLLDEDAGKLLPEKSRRYLTTIIDASREMGQLIDNLLEFSRMGRTQMADTAVNLNILVHDTIRGLDPAISGREIEWTIPELPEVRGDPAMLKQVFSNLLGNAVKYTNTRGKAKIEIGTGGKENGKIIFFVKDNGVGFDMQYVNKLFGVFQRLHRSDEFEGTGIGLANVRRIITRHGGRTWAEGAIDKGATFYFTLNTAIADTST